MAALVVPPGLDIAVVVVLLVLGSCSIPSFALVILSATAPKGKMPFTVPSLPAAAPENSPVLTQFAGNTTAGAAAPTAGVAVVISDIKVAVRKAGQAIVPCSAYSRKSSHVTTYRIHGNGVQAAGIGTGPIYGIGRRPDQAVNIIMYGSRYGIGKRYRKCARCRVGFCRIIDSCIGYHYGNGAINRIDA